MLKSILPKLLKNAYKLKVSKNKLIQTALHHLFWLLQLKAMKGGSFIYQQSITLVVCEHCWTIEKKKVILDILLETILHQRNKIVFQNIRKFSSPFSLLHQLFWCRSWSLARQMKVCLIREINTSMLVFWSPMLLCYSLKAEENTCCQRCLIAAYYCLWI